MEKFILTFSIPFHSVPFRVLLTTVCLCRGQDKVYMHTFGERIDCSTNHFTKRDSDNWFVN